MASNSMVLQINKLDLEELLSAQAKSIVGKVCKRFELSDNKETIKAEVKELLYEHSRLLKDLLVAYDSGVRVVTKIDFTKPKDF